MADLLSHKAKICITAAGVLIHDGKVLLVKHKKLGLWLNPGGHLDPNEAPHHAAEREFWEETGVKVTAKPFGVQVEDDRVEFIPSPFETDVHWVSEENYQARTKNDATLAANRKYMGRDCEQHLNLVYLVEPVDGVDFAQNVEETDGIAWFTPEELEELDTPEAIKVVVREAFRLSL